MSAEKFLNAPLNKALLRLKNKELEFFGESKDIHIWKNHYKTNFVISYD